MPDVYATIAEADNDLQESLATVLELRAADPAQRAMLEEYTARLALRPGSELLEVGCGTGAICRFLATLPGIERVTGVDPSELFVGRARELGGDLPLDFVAGDGRELPFGDEQFDALVFHTSLCHMPGCERALGEAYRVLRPGGRLAVFDGDYATMTFANGNSDPLQSCAEAVLDMLVHDPWLMRRLARLLVDAGFESPDVQGHAYTSTSGTDYFLALVDRGADALEATRSVGAGGAAALKTEARERIANGSFFGHIAYVSALSRRPRQAATASG
jgi:ubiquinone/menaquinone biosynthesis C-methylase UbiE